ncbi:MAG: substrate-binding domain-containing protein [Bacilli bacterium]
MKLTKLAMSALAVSMTIGVGGWSSATQAAAYTTAHRTAAKTPVIGVTLMTLTNPYFATMGNAFVKYAKLHGMKAIVDGANMSQSTMLQQVDSFIEQHVSAVVMAPPDATAAVSAVLALNRAHIPVFTVDTNIDVAALHKEHGRIVQFVGSNNYQAGLIAGQEMAAYLKGKGDIGWIDFPTAQSVQLRDKGFLKIIDKYPGIHVVSRLNGDGSTPGGLTAASEALAAHPAIKAFFDINAPCGLGAVSAIQAAHDVGKVAVIGLSGSQAAVKAIQNNSVFKFGAMQEPSLEANIEVQNIAKYLHGVRVPAQILTPVFRITRQNAAKFAPVAYH